MLTFTSTARVAEAVAAGRHIEFSAYVMRGNALSAALATAARSGADVEVTLQAHPFADSHGTLAAENERIAERLRQAGARVRMVDDDEAPVHLKAAIVDGVAFLDDRNWPDGASANTVVETDQADDVAIVRDALHGATRGDGHLQTRKFDALEQEANVISTSPGDRVDCASETFSYSPVMLALAGRARHGAHVRLLVDSRDVAKPSSARERAALNYLVRNGVEVHAGATAEKLCVAGERGWAGSANATLGAKDTVDWGLRVDEPELVARLEDRFTADWAQSRAYAPA